MPKTDLWTTLTIGVEMTLIACGATGCDMQFAAPTTWVQARRSDHKTWYCPNGHPRMYGGPSEAEKLREQLATANGNLKFHRERADRLTDANLRLPRSRAAARGQVTKLRNKAKNGICAFCDHSVPDLAAHVAEAHPDVSADASEEDEATG